MLSKNQYKQIKEELDYSKKPLFLFDDDPDGFSAFLLLYRYKKEGKGIPVKAKPMIDRRFLKNVEDYDPDKIFVLDVPMIDESFTENVKVPIIWIDHHGPYETHGTIRYFNPRIKNKKDNFSTTCNAYMAVKQDLWIAMVGMVGDWQLHKELADEFSKKYPDLLSPTVKRPQDALFNSKLGELIKIISFVLKGETKMLKKSMEAMARIEDPHDILEQRTEDGAFIYSRYSKLAERYNELLKEIEDKVTRSKLLHCVYEDDSFSFTKELSNEILYRHPDKIILIGRKRSGEVKISMRAAKKILPPMLEKALVGVDGYGGGHEHACGACVKADDFDKFLKQLKEQL